MVTFITGNERKVKVLKLLLNPYKVEFDHIKLDLEEIQTKDPSTLVLKKVQEAYSHIKRACFVEDTEWSIPALNGFPGLFMKYINEWFKTEDWIKLMKDYTDKRVFCINHYGCVDNKGNSFEISAKTELIIKDEWNMQKEAKGTWSTPVDFIFYSPIVDKTISDFNLEEDRTKVFGDKVAYTKLSEFIKLNS